MGRVNLDNILVKSLSRIATNGGDVMHALKDNDMGYDGFGEAYFSWIIPGAIKAWKCHKKMTMNIIVPVGNVRFVFYGLDKSSNKTFRVEEIGDDRYKRIAVPPGVWFGFQSISKNDSLVLNIANISHDPSEVDRLEISDIKYKWNNL